MTAYGDTSFVATVDKILRAPKFQRADGRTIVVENRERTVVSLKPENPNFGGLIGLILLIEWMTRSLGQRLDTNKETRAVVELAETLKPHELTIEAIVKPNPATMLELTWLAGQWVIGGLEPLPQHLAVIPLEQHESIRAIIVASVIIHLGREQTFDDALLELLLSFDER